MERLDGLLQRRILFNIFMLLLNVLILGILAFIACGSIGAGSGVDSVVDKNFAFYKDLTYSFTIIFGIVICFVWRTLRIYYRENVAVRSKTIYEIEQIMLVRAHTSEAEEMEKRNNNAFSSVAFIENMIPLIIIVLYMSLIFMHLSNFRLLDMITHFSQ